MRPKSDKKIYFDLPHKSKISKKIEIETNKYKVK